MAIQIVIDADDKDVEALLGVVSEGQRSYGRQDELLEKALEWMRLLGAATSCRTLTGSCQASIRIGEAPQPFAMLGDKRAESSACQVASQEVRR